MSETPPGWYEAPDASDLLRFWDGEMWTDRTRPAPLAQTGPSAGTTGAPTLPVQTSDAVRAALEEDEWIEAGFHSGAVRTGYFVATGRRVIILKPQGVRGKTFEVHSFAYDEIESIGVSAWGSLKVLANGQEFTGSNLGEGVLANFVMAVRNRMPRPASVDLSAMPAPSSGDDDEDAAPMEAATGPNDGGDSLPDQVRELAELHASGILTDDEFAAAKAKLFSV